MNDEFLNELHKEDVLKNLDQVKGWIKEIDSKPKGVIIYKKDGSVLHKTNCATMKRAIEKHKADLREADLRGANILGADLRGANLRGANLRGADLRGANLRGADLRGANILGADLQNAKFYGLGGTSELTKEQVPDFLAALGFVIEE